MEQYHDGTFGDIKPLPDKMKELLNMIPGKQSTVNGVFIGSREELEEVRKQLLQELAQAKGIKP